MGDSGTRVRPGYRFFRGSLKTSKKAFKGCRKCLTSSYPGLGALHNLAYICVSRITKDLNQTSTHYPHNSLATFSFKCYDLAAVVLYISVYLKLKKKSTCECLVQRIIQILLCSKLIITWTLSTFSVHTGYFILISQSFKSNIFLENITY